MLQTVKILMLVQYESILKLLLKMQQCVKTSKGLSETFSQQCGVVRGDFLSPILFVTSINKLKQL